MSQHPLSQETRRLANAGFSRLRTTPSCKEQEEPESNLDRVYDAWLASRAVVPQQPKGRLSPGAQRPFNRRNAQLALAITKYCAYDLCKILITLHPGRTTLMLSLNIARSLSPAYRGYRQAVALNEVCALCIIHEDDLIDVNTAPISYCRGEFQLGLPHSISGERIAQANFGRISGIICVCLQPSLCLTV